MSSPYPALGKYLITNAEYRNHVGVPELGTTQDGAVIALKKMVLEEPLW